MPHLMVNLDDVTDCKKAIEILAEACEPGGRKKRGRRHGGPCDDRGRHEEDHGRHGRPGGRRGKPDHEDLESLPVPQKLRRIRNRKMWGHLLKIAQSAEKPLSLPELDELLDMRKNKMRSLKAIMAKLERRFDLVFLEIAPDAGEDVSGNPRYLMPTPLRRQILKVADEEE